MSLAHGKPVDILLRKTVVTAGDKSLRIYPTPANTWPPVFHRLAQSNSMRCEAWKIQQQVFINFFSNDNSVCINNRVADHWKLNLRSENSERTFDWLTAFRTTLSGSFWCRLGRLIIGVSSGNTCC